MFITTDLSITSYVTLNDPEQCFQRKNTKISARWQCVYEGPYSKEIYS